MKKIPNIIIICTIILFTGCKSRNSTEASEPNSNKGSLQQSLPAEQIPTTTEQENSIDTSQTIAIDSGTETKILIDTNTPQTDSNEIKIPIAEPNLTKAVDNEPNQQAAIPEPNTTEPNTPQDIGFYKKCAQILNEYVDIAGNVDYTDLKRSRYDLRALLAEFAALEPNIYNQWPKDDKIAFWINIYNLHTLNFINDHYPIESGPFERIFRWPSDSIRYIDREVGGIVKQKFTVMNEAFTLSEIEERFLAEQFNVPLAFFALYHGGKSGPPLLNKPYTAKDLHSQLEAQVKKVLANSSEFNIDVQNKKVNLPAFLEPSWFGQYFIKSHYTDKFFKDQRPAVTAVLNFLTNYLSEQQINFLKLENYNVRFTPYNWSLKDRSFD